MKVPLSWLRDYVPLEMPIAELVERLAITSCEVERVSRRGVADSDGNFGRFRVGRVVEAAKHPNADRLQLCRVDVGEGEPRSIVCGAWNFGTGATVAVGLPGAVLPDGLRLEKRKLRGEVSEGMILSERELELSAEHGGILVFPDALEPGTPLADVLPLGDDVLEVEVTGNRPDLLSVYGIAREVAALYDLPLRSPLPPLPPCSGEEQVDVRVEAADGCPRFVARIFRGVRLGPSPPWLKARITAAGMRPISNVVDVTNYVMLGLGNPQHAYDLAKLAQGRLLVRRAAAGERVRTLDGAERELDARDLVIADPAHAVAIAGIMGSEDSEVEDSTVDVLLESANFEPVGILRSSERLRLRTEGSNRWEKGVDPHLARDAADLATALLVELTGARWSGATDVHGELPARPVVRLRPARATALVGHEAPPAARRGLLDRLGFDVADDWTVVVPTWRARDVTREVDVVEELARFELPDVPFTLPLRRAMFGRLTLDQRLRRTVEDVLVGAGYSEAYTWSLVADDPAEGALRLPDPLSGEHAVLRTTLRHGLVESALRNAHAGNERVALFEIARVYLPADAELPEERWRVAGIAQGGFPPAKGAVETLLAALKVEQPFAPGGRRRAVLAAGEVLELAEERLPGAWGYFELDLASLLPAMPERVVYEDVVTYPALKQDLAFVVDERARAGELAEAARAAAGAELREFRVFDVYRGEPIPAGKKSLAFAVAFQSPERTLSDEDAARLRERIVGELGRRFGATLRA